MALLSGCAAPPPDDDPESRIEFEHNNDPLEPTNRAIFEFNEFVDTYAARPVAQGYRAVVPPFVRDRVANFLSNLQTPIVLANDLLQGNLTRAGITVQRALLNSSFGVAGLMDVAEPMGIRGHSADLGQTFGVWGVDSGPYLVLPLFGPSNPRDAIGMGAEAFADPLDITLENNSMRWLVLTRSGVSAVSQREAYLDILDDVKRTSLDYYSAMRSLYQQHRKAEIEGEKQ